MATREHNEALEAQAYEAKKALEALRKMIGNAPWIDKAVISCDALWWGSKVGDDGRPVRDNGKPMTWKDMGVTK